MAIHIVGGAYRERCMHPTWDETYGSAGRAAAALSAMGTPVVLHTYLDAAAAEVIRDRAAFAKDFTVQGMSIPETVSFHYDHDLAIPQIRGVPEKAYDSLVVKAEHLVRFGMLEGDAIIDADYAVFDPQNMGVVVPFRANGSSANHLALILNQSEARRLSGVRDGSMPECAEVLFRQENAEVVVIKMGPRGALVWSDDSYTQVPAYRTSHVWKLGSGDCFVAHFANAWMYQRRSPVEAARIASRATAYYCETQGFPSPDLLAAFERPEIAISAAMASGVVREVYLAGPFFNLPQRWLIEQARANLHDVGLSVFSPFHQVGLGSANDVVHQDLRAIEKCDMLFAIVDGLDPGTIFEIGYAKALSKPVIIYSESESDARVKIMIGSSCVMCDSYATAIYSALWEAIKI